jgi:hypothetical protein
MLAEHVDRHHRGTNSNHTSTYPGYDGVRGRHNYE